MSLAAAVLRQGAEDCRELPRPLHWYNSCLCCVSPALFLDRSSCPRAVALHNFHASSWHSGVLLRLSLALPDYVVFCLFFGACRYVDHTFPGEKGKGSLGKPLHYKGSKFHRIIPRFMLQGMFCSPSCA
jgi:hypothetical protein